MDPIRGNSSYNVQSSSANTAQAVQAAAEKHPSGHASSLTSAMLSHHAFDALNAKEAQGSEQEKTLARFAKQAINSGRLQRSPNQPQNGIAQFGVRRNQDILVIKAKLNERSEYDILSVGFKSGSGGTASLKLPIPVNVPEGTSAKLPPKHSLLGMPTELKWAIMEHVFTGSTKRQGADDLSALEKSSRLLKAELEGNSLLKFKHDLQNKIIGAVEKLSVGELTKMADSGLFALASAAKKEACLAAAIESLDEGSICALGGALEVLDPAQRSRLVNAILNAVADDEGDIDMEDDHAITGNMIGSLGAGMHTIAIHHTDIIDSIMKLPDSGKCWAIYGLGKALHTLDTRSREIMVHAALNMEDEDSKATAIGGLAQGMSALTEQQRNAVFDAALQIDNESEFSDPLMPGLCLGFQTLTTGQQIKLVITVSEMIDEDEQTRSLRELGPALKSVNPHRYIDALETLRNSVLSMHSETNKALALGFLGSGLNDENSPDGFHNERYEQLATNIFSSIMELVSDLHKSLAVSALKDGLSAFTIEQRSSLVETCLNMKNEENKSRAVSGLRAGLQALTHEQKENLIEASLSMTNGMAKSDAIASLGEAISAFTAEQQARLVDAAVGEGILFKDRVIASLSGIEDIQQYGRLIDAATILPSSNSQGPFSPQARALASLAKTEHL